MCDNSHVPNVWVMVVLCLYASVLMIAFGQVVGQVVVGITDP